MFARLCYSQAWPLTFHYMCISHEDNCYLFIWRLYLFAFFLQLYLGSFSLLKYSLFFLCIDYCLVYTLCWSWARHYIYMSILSLLHGHFIDMILAGSYRYSHVTRRYINYLLKTCLVFDKIPNVTLYTQLKLWLWEYQLGPYNVWLELCCYRIINFIHGFNTSTPVYFVNYTMYLRRMVYTEHFSRKDTSPPPKKKRKNIYHVTISKKSVFHTFQSPLVVLQTTEGWTLDPVHVGTFSYPVHDYGQQKWFLSFSFCKKCILWHDWWVINGFYNVKTPEACVFVTPPPPTLCRLWWELLHNDEVPHGVLLSPTLNWQSDGFVCKPNAGPK